MKRWKNVITMALAVVMVTLTPMSVLAESTEIAATEIDVAAVEETQEKTVEETEVEAIVEEMAETDEEVGTEDISEVEETPETEVFVVSETMPNENNMSGAEISTEAVTEPQVEEITRVDVLKTDGSAFKMFVVSEWTAKQNGDQVEISLSTTNTSYDKLYLGSKDDENKTPVIQGTELASGGWTFSFTVPASQKGTSQSVVLGKPDGTWYTKQELVLTIPTNVEEVQDSTPEPTLPADGKYTVSAETGAAMFKVYAAVLTVKDGEMTAEITLSGSGQDNLYMGTAGEAATATEENIIAGELVTVDGKDRYKFTIPVSALDTPIVVASQSASNDKWFDRTITFDSTTLAPYVYIPEDGQYTVSAETGAAMFKVYAAVLTVENGEMTAEITLSGSGQDNLYMGTAEEAAAASEENIIAGTKVTVDGKDRYKFTIPVSALDTPIVVASQSASNDKWFDRTITFDSATLEAISDDSQNDNQNGNTNQENTNQGNTGVTDDEAIKDMIDNTTKGEVKDGTYTPSFGYKGGSGRVTLSCSKVVVKNGKATATIVFSSPNFTYMKVNGTKYYNTNPGGNSTFVVPVKLNGTTTVAAETTAMSVPYEVEYVLYVYVDGTNVSNIKTPTKADTDETEEETTEEETEVTTEEAEEENSWGAFNSEQTKESEEVSTDSAEEAGSSAALPIAAVVAVAAVAGVAVVTVLKKKSNRG